MPLKNHQQYTATIPPIVDADGKPSEIDNPPVWNNSNDAIVEVIPAEDGMSALIKARGPSGSFLVSAEGDADLGDGVAPIFWTLNDSVAPGTAVGGTLTTSAPEDQPVIEG